MHRSHASWLSLAFDTWSLGLEASTVIGLRMLKLSAGGAAAEAEAQRMVREKVEAAIAWQMLALTGGLGRTAHSAGRRSVNHYRRAVRSNRRRLRD